MRYGVTVQQSRGLVRVRAHESIVSSPYRRTLFEIRSRIQMNRPVREPVPRRYAGDRCTGLTAGNACAASRKEAPRCLSSPTIHRHGSFLRGVPQAGNAHRFVSVVVNFKTRLTA